MKMGRGGPCLGVPPPSKQRTETKAPPRPPKKPKRGLTLDREGPCVAEQQQHALVVVTSSAIWRRVVHHELAVRNRNGSGVSHPDKRLNLADLGEQKISLAQWVRFVVDERCRETQQQLTLVRVSQDGSDEVVQARPERAEFAIVAHLDVGDVQSGGARGAGHGRDGAVVRERDEGRAPLRDLRSGLMLLI